VSLQAVLFDLDGTLVDTEPAASRAIQEVFRSWGRPLAQEDSSVITGRTWGAAVELLEKKYGLPVTHRQAVETLMIRYRQELSTGVTEIPGARDCVLRLHQEKTPLALVSGSQRSEILHALGALGLVDCFPVLLGAEDYPRSKPAPDGYLKALKQLGAEPSRCVILEDSVPGIQSALAAGTQVVAVEYANHFAQDQSLAHVRVPDLRGVTPDWLRKQVERR
jgi:HAD superfamily hydrolase (TIGR01509 family)